MRTTEQILASLDHAPDHAVSLPDQLCHDCTQALELAGAAMSLVTDRGLQAIVGATEPTVGRLEALQFEVGEGPSVDACRDNRSSRHVDLDDGGVARWPAFAPAALDAGIRSVQALPLQVGAVGLGGLGLYKETPGPLLDDAASSASAYAYADAAVAVLLELQGQAGSDNGLHPQLDAPVRYHAVVHQATGFLSVQASVSVAEALLLLRARAYASNRDLPEIARDVIAGRLQIRPRGSKDE